MISAASCLKMLQKYYFKYFSVRCLWIIKARIWINSLRSVFSIAPVKPTTGEQWRGIVSGLEDHSHFQSYDSRPIVFAPLWASSSKVNKALESVMARALAIRGVPVRVLGCGKGLRACVIDPWGNRRGNCDNLDVETPSVCPSCCYLLSDIYKGSGISTDFLAQYISDSDHSTSEAMVNRLGVTEITEFVFEDIPHGRHALASALRATGRGVLDPDDPQHLLLIRRQLLASLIVAKAAEKYFKKYHPARLVLMHGIYSDHGPLADCAKKAGIPITVFSRPYRKNTVMLCHGDTYHRALIDEPVELWENHVPSPLLRARLLKYIESRKTGKDDYVTYHPNPTVGRQAIFNETGLDAKKPIISLFTNVMWDAALFHASSAFRNMLDWVFETIEIYTQKPDLQLVIRVHPAEVKAPKRSQQPVVREIKRIYRSLPHNIFVVPPESNLSSYDLVEESSACIVYGTKMALEIVLRGVPTLVAGESFVRGKGFTLDASTPAQYRELLKDLHLQPRLNVETLERARRYAEHFFFRRQIDFSLISEDENGLPALTMKSIESLKPGRTPELDAICDGLIKGNEILDPRAI